MELAAIVVVIVVALGFDYTNGFHDAANAIATSVSTRALTPRVALLMAAVMNVAGGFLGTEVASTVGSGIIDAPVGEGGLVVVLAALLGAIAWNLVTWYFGMPSSSSHALIGGLVGAALASAGTVKWSGVLDKVIIPMVVSPVVGLLLAAALMVALLWIFRRGRPTRLTRGFRHAQTVSAAAMALGHGLQDAQKTMGVIVLALVVGGYHEGFDVPWWVILLSAGALSAGTYTGGWRIMRTLGRRIIDLDPPHGFAAEATASALLYTTAFVFAAPISTTQTITASILGVGATKRLSAVRWGVGRRAGVLGDPRGARAHRLTPAHPSAGPVSASIRSSAHSAQRRCASACRTPISRASRPKRSRPRGWVAASAAAAISRSSAAWCSASARCARTCSRASSGVSAESSIIRTRCSSRTARGLAGDSSHSCRAARPASVSA
jgi:PiT family inorganic phosphate transporter